MAVLVAVPVALLEAEATVALRALGRRSLRTLGMKMESSTPAGAVGHSGIC